MHRLRPARIRQFRAHCGFVALLAAAACQSPTSTVPIANARSAAAGADGAPATHASAPSLRRTPAEGESIRVGGDMTSEVTGRDGDFRAGPCRIDTPLPLGYPMPTPPGAIEIKSYPLVRRAEVRGGGTPDSGMNRAFWPLFNHIKSHDIAMTSPVEMDYGDEPGDWTMAFLYRSPDMNRVGQEGRVEVRDAEPTVVIAVGLKGDYSMSLVRRGQQEIDAWMASQSEWVYDGPWRSLYYNGPSIFWWNKWAEVQRPIRLAPAS
ncbi:MAG: heme-binding protein [Phycisphaeraceae bacterium]|nr:heme-binding protein [Phycisphaeraceae bacterium]